MFPDLFCSKTPYVFPPILSFFPKILDPPPPPPLISPNFLDFILSPYFTLLPPNFPESQPASPFTRSPTFSYLARTLTFLPFVDPPLLLPSSSPPLPLALFLLPPSCPPSPPFLLPSFSFLAPLPSPLPRLAVRWRGVGAEEDRTACMPRAGWRPLRRLPGPATWMWLRLVLPATPRTGASPPPRLSPPTPQLHHLWERDEKAVETVFFCLLLSFI